MLVRLSLFQSYNKLSRYDGYFSYSMTFYILADNSSLGAMEAIDKSKKMMENHKKNRYEPKTIESCKMYFFFHTD